jgi:hypothetical protein
MADLGSADTRESANVFISYSRKDKDFAVRLIAGLKLAGKSAWIDLEIPLTVIWEEHIRGKIEGTDVFIFVVSPHSVVSEHCNRELGLARQQHKRIVPILFQEFDAKQLVGELYDKPWEETARENWKVIPKWQRLSFQESDNFEDSLVGLIAAIDKDLPHVQSHTRWLQRASEWNSNERDESLFLRGKLLQEAEDWLKDSAHKDPSPSNLHYEYIEASREAEKKIKTREDEIVGVITTAKQELVKTRRKYWKIIAGILVIVAALGIGAYFGGRGSQIHALDETARSDDATSWSPDETRVLTIDTGNFSNLVYVWDAKTGEKLLTLAEHTGTVRDAAWSPDGSKIATASIDKTAKVWDAVTGKVLLTFSEHTDDISVIAWSPDGTRLVTGGDDRIARVWDATTGKVLATFSLHQSAITSAQWSHDGSEIITTDHTRHTYIWDSSTGEKKAFFVGLDALNNV